MASLAVVRAIAPSLKSSGYRRSGQTWRKVHDGGVLVVNVQRAYDTVFVNLGACIGELGCEDDVPFNRCHIWLRLEWVCPPEFFETVRSATLDSVPDSYSAAFEQHGLPWLESLMSRGGVHDFLHSALWNHGMVAGPVWAWAGVPRR